MKIAIIRVNESFFYNCDKYIGKVYECKKLNDYYESNDGRLIKCSDGLELQEEDTKPTPKDIIVSNLITQYWEFSPTDSALLFSKIIENFHDDYDTFWVSKEHCEVVESESITIDYNSIKPISRDEVKLNDSSLKKMIKVVNELILANNTMGNGKVKILKSEMITRFLKQNPDFTEKDIYDKNLLLNIEEIYGNEGWKVSYKIAKESYFIFE